MSRRAPLDLFHNNLLSLDIIAIDKAEHVHATGKEVRSQKSEVRIGFATEQLATQHVDYLEGSRAREIID